MDDPNKKILHDAIQETVAREGEIVTHWYLTAEVHGQDGEGYTAHRASTLSGDFPTRPEILGMLATSLIMEAADTVRAQRAPGEDD